MGKMKIGIYCYFIANILRKVFKKCLLSGPNIHLLSKLLSLIGCHGNLGSHGNQKALFAKKYSKINSSEAIWGIMLKLCRNFHSISFYKSIVFFFLLFLHMHFDCYGSLVFQ